MKISLSLAVLGVLMCSTVYAENLSSKSLDTKHAQLCRDKGGLDVTSKIQIKRTSHVKDMVVCQMSKPSSSYNIQSSSSNGSLTVTAPYGEVRTLTDPMGKWVEYQVTGLAVYSYDGPYTDKIADIEMSVTNFCSDEFTQNMNPDYVYWIQYTCDTQPTVNNMISKMAAYAPADSGIKGDAEKGTVTYNP